MVRWLFARRKRVSRVEAGGNPDDYATGTTELTAVGETALRWRRTTLRQGNREPKEAGVEVRDDRYMSAREAGKVTTRLANKLTSMNLRVLPRPGRQPGGLSPSYVAWEIAA
jgi:hypothetical protein